MKEFLLEDVADGTYYCCAKIYKYLRDNVFNMFQKFLKALGCIYACNPTGVTEGEKVNMVVALFNGETQKMDYAFKNYDYKKEWKLFQGWMAVERLPKFSLISGMTSTTSNSSTTEDDGGSSCNKFVVTRLLLRGIKRGREKSKENKKDKTQIRKRQQAQDVQIEGMQKEMQRMSALVERRISAAIMEKALTVTTDDEA